MEIEIGWFIVAVIISVGIGALLYRRQKPALSVPYLLVVVIGTLFAVYYILNVLFGTGRTGWP
ncbi:MULTISPECIES: hypothetical protein [unclassified Pseudodesulfovibrio]|uniref:hypothetical protein n=1 Tax=unclassified Pseudodesulfovibrio TaxID=2661612 RepID=UPI000FEB849A|nr:MULTISPECIES: hypothetical protein [unclassified Pseudodesulfovibrio]MCJ2163234.1 hypothetical protein [Pseudodesulfovibrio sp. S3-i]